MARIDFEAARLRMVAKQLRAREITDDRVLAAMGRVPRERFLPVQLYKQAYADRALPIECSQTISQPYIVALMTQALRLSGREKVLEVGTGSGYQTAILAELARQVVTLERHADLSRDAVAVLAELGYRNVTAKVGDGTLGCRGEAPFDRIIVTAAAEDAPPALLEQLAEDGILVIPLGGRDYQTLKAIRKPSGAYRSVDLSACRFVPLVGNQGWPERSGDEL